jgi:hypothetical protein
MPELPRVSTTTSVARPPSRSSANTATATILPALDERFSGAKSGRCGACALGFVLGFVLWTMGRKRSSAGRVERSRAL